MAVFPVADGLGHDRPPVPPRVAVDNVMLAFAALYEAISRGKTDRAEQRIIGTPFHMIAYRVQMSDTSETLHFEIHPNRSRT